MYCAVTEACFVQCAGQRELHLAICLAECIMHAAAVYQLLHPSAVVLMIGTTSKQMQNEMML